MTSDHTQRIISRIFEAIDFFKNDEINEESLSACIESNMQAIEQPDLSLIEERLINLIAFLDDASYIVPYSKKKSSITIELKKFRTDVSNVLGMSR